MNNRLKQFIAAENITQAQFADNINVVRASVSHVLSGRNNPSYDFIRSIMLKYPRLNIEWLMFGKGKMYNDTNDTNVQELLFPEPVERQEAESPAPLSEIITSDTATELSVNQRKVSKVIILFDDGSYQEL